MSISGKCVFISLVQVVFVALLYFAVKYLLPSFFEGYYLALVIITSAILAVFYVYRVWLRNNDLLSVLKAAFPPLGFLFGATLQLLINGPSVFHGNYIGNRVSLFALLIYFILFSGNEVAFVRRKFSSDMLSVISAERASIFAIIISVLLQLPVLFI